MILPGAVALHPGDRAGHSHVAFASRQRSREVGARVAGAGATLHERDSDASASRGPRRRSMRRRARPGTPRIEGFVGTRRRKSSSIDKLNTAKRPVTEDALGMIRLKGFVAMVEVARRHGEGGWQRSSSSATRRSAAGFVTAIVRGDVAAVKAATEAGQRAAERIGEMVAVASSAAARQRRSGPAARPGRQHPGDPRTRPLKTARPRAGTSAARSASVNGIQAGTTTGIAVLVARPHVPDRQRRTPTRGSAAAVSSPGSRRDRGCVPTRQRAGRQILAADDPGRGRSAFVVAR